ncbi:TPA: gp58-like family protein [Streptococcus pyogenes]
MSRDPTLLIDESNLTIGSDGRAYYTFTADGDTKSVKIANNKCIGTTRFNQLMIERGGKPTNYVAPVVVEGTGNPTGLFKDLKEISLELTDTKNSKLWSKIKLNNQGMIEEYYNGTIKSEIIKTAEGTQQRISSETDKKLALINETVSGIRREYQDADRQLSSSYQAGIEGLKATMANDKIGLQAEIQTTAQGLYQRYDNEIRKLSAKITTTSSGTLDASKARIINLNASSIVGLDANFIKAKIGYAIVDMLEGKVIKARNSAMLIDLSSAKMDFNSNATINFNSRDNALVRKDGTHTAFVHFSNATPKGYTGSALYASIGITSSGDGVNSASSGRFAGLRSFRYATGYNHTAAVDQTELYGDNVLIADDFSINRGFKFRPDKMEKVLDMNDLYAAVVALGRCWGHLANVGWNTAHSNFTNAVTRELSNYIGII